MTNEGHVFISYVHEDAEAVDLLALELEARGAATWLDRNQINPGEDWRLAIRRAIEHGAYFVACFSAHYAARNRTHMNEELDIAIDELRRRPRDRAWFLPVLLDPDTVPDWDIDAVRTLRSFQQVRLYDDWDRGVGRLLDVVSPHKSRSANDPAAKEESRFKLPVSATYPSMGNLFDSFVDAALYTERNPRKDLHTRLRNGQPFPASMRYATSSGGKSWLRLCQDPRFNFHHNAVRFWWSPHGSEVADLVMRQLDRPDFNYLSLGCGDGVKDVHLLEHWLRMNADLTYYPYDVSLDLLRTTVSLATSKIPEGALERLHIKAVLANFSALDQMGELFQQRPSPNVISLLGNNLAALDNELVLLDAIRKRMSDNDLLILEVRLTGDAHSSVPTSYDKLDFSDAELAFFFGPLQDLGIPYDPARIDVAKRRDASTINGATTLAVDYRELNLDSELFESVSLAYIHRYVADDLLETLQGIGLDLVASRVHSRGESPTLVCVVSRTG